MTQMNRNLCQYHGVKVAQDLVVGVSQEAISVDFSEAHWYKKEGLLKIKKCW